MLIDNKTPPPEKGGPQTIIHYLKDSIENGPLDVVTGYFSVSALAFLLDNINKPERFRMILGNLMSDDREPDKIINLLNSASGIEDSLSVRGNALKAVNFLEQDKVQVKSIQKSFCHAKTYIYTDKTKPKNSFFIVGSSNLTDAGLGMRPSGNIELNKLIESGNDNDFKEAQNWFADKWKETAQETFTLPDKKKVPVKTYLIDLIQNLYKPYSPYDLYYKVLYELFRKDFESLTLDEAFRHEIKHLEDTALYNVLFSYQQKGVISLIKMLKRYGGAILGDAVGLGKTWTALGVMKYFEMNGYKVVVFCPKKLRHNWAQYGMGTRSRFEGDNLEFAVRHHSDLQEGRLDSYEDRKLGWLQAQPKLLLIVDESHNLRNDKSLRYQFLVDNLLQGGKPNRDVKILHLSATPINNKLTDVRNQFKLIARGDDKGFAQTDLDIGSLEVVFRQAQEQFKKWSNEPQRTVAGFVATLPQKFFTLTDALIVARTRRLIEEQHGTELNFPKKDAPVNEYVSPGPFGKLADFEAIMNALPNNLTAYRPHDYIKPEKDDTEKTGRERSLENIDDPQQREQFLVRMMFKLLMKRLESSWYSFSSTVGNILAHHENALQKVELFEQTKQAAVITVDIDDQTAEEFDDTGEEQEAADLITLGKKNPVALSSMRQLTKFKAGLKRDIKALRGLKGELDQFAIDYNQRRVEDPKLETLVGHIRAKQKAGGNLKIIVFTTYKDTAQHLYNQLRNRYDFEHVAYVSGDTWEADVRVEPKSRQLSLSRSFESLLQRFAPFTKLYRERDWTDLYEQHANQSHRKNGHWQVPFDEWQTLIGQHDTEVQRLLDNPIDILIATDCLSEGQNLQDADCVVNYDVHWNPVRLIQRFGRIDRIGSPNERIRGINFWPASDFDDYLNLKGRVESRMALMTLVGSELYDRMTPELEQMIQDNPLLTRQSERMLEQLQSSWDEVENSEQTLGLDNLSLEQFRQELFDFFRQNEDFFKRIPNGVFTGFKLIPEGDGSRIPDSLVAVLGYPKRPEPNDREHVYEDIYLLHQPTGKPDAPRTLILANNPQILTLLRRHKQQSRYVPEAIDRGNADALKPLASAIDAWLKAQVPQQAVMTIQDLFNNGISAGKSTLSAEDRKIEEKFKSDQMDLINWFVITDGPHSV